MSEPKRPQSKDISDLKARLGLKKGAASAEPQAGDSGSAPAAASQAAPMRGPAAAFAPVTPPPGIHVPPPPGTQPPPMAAAQPAMPNAADDPFGAMNAMAQMRAVQRAPEMIIVNDGKPVENVGASGKGVGLAKMIVPAIVALGLGVAIGQMAKNGAHYNEGIRGAGDILSVVKTSKKTINELDKTLDDLSKNNFKPTKELSAEVAKLAGKLEVKEEIVFRYKQNALDSAVSGRTLAFFAGIAELKSMLDQHTKAAQFDDIALVASKAKLDKAAVTPSENAPLASIGATRYGVLLNNPTAEEAKAAGGSLGASFVELGKPLCGDGKAADSGACSDGVTGFQYRSDGAGATWANGKLAKAGPGDNVAPKSLLLLDKSGTLLDVLKGSPETAASALYTKRLSTIFARVKTLLEEGNRLESDLTKKSRESKKFTFFL
ncbi:MAG: hypothetical protein KBG15_21905 [Kofleriaceae bacterium]|nr:hypothetical protein [Kofleriaceae bacterium]